MTPSPLWTGKTPPSLFSFAPRLWFFRLTSASFTLCFETQVARSSIIKGCVNENYTFSNKIWFFWGPSAESFCHKKALVPGEVSDTSLLCHLTQISALRDSSEGHPLVYSNWQLFYNAMVWREAGTQQSNGSNLFWLIYHLLLLEGRGKPMSHLQVVAVTSWTLSLTLSKTRAESERWERAGGKPACVVCLKVNQWMSWKTRPSVSFSQKINIRYPPCVISLY